MTPKVYEYISTGETLGLFQIESAGMQDLAKKLKPSGFEDIIAMLALYRPGPMDRECWTTLWTKAWES